MRRRTLLIGLGTAAGAAGAVGSGAFTSVTAQRDVTVRVADDANALLSMQPGDGPNADAFSTVSDGTVGLDFSSTSAGGSGLGTDSTYEFDDVLRVRNQGTQRVYLFATVSGGVSNDELYFYPGSDSTTELRDGTDEVIPLDPGEAAELGVFVDTSVVESDVTATATFNATADKPAESIQGGRGSVLVSKQQGRGDFEAVQAAVDSIQAGETDATTIEIDTGTFGGDGPIEVTEPNGLQFRGSGDGSDGTVLDSRLRLSGGSPVAGVAVRNLRIEGTAGGPALEIGTGTQTVENAVVDGVTVTDNGGDGVGLNPARNLTVRDSVIENSANGIVVDGPGVAGTTVSITGSRIAGNDTEGVSLYADSFETISVTDSTITGNAGTGLFAGTPFAGDLDASSEAAVDVAELTGLSVGDNGGAGVVLSSGTITQAIVENVAVRDNATNGLDLNGVAVSAGTISRVTAAGNGGTGIALGSFAPAASVAGQIGRTVAESNGGAGGYSGIAVFDGVGETGTALGVQNSNVVSNAGFGVETDDAADGVTEVQLSNVFLDGNAAGTSAGVGGSTSDSRVPNVGANTN